MSDLDNFDELETIVDSIRGDKCRDGRVKNSEQFNAILESCRASANKIRPQDLKPGNRLRLSAYTPSLAKLKFMQGD